MSFEDFVKNGLVKKSAKDVSLAKSLLATADSDLSFLSKLPINEESARKVTTNYYDVLRSILEAMSALQGYKIYSHEAFAYLLKAQGKDVLAEKFDRLRRIRNSINYYGKNISVDESKEAVTDILRMISQLKEEIKL